ncbi:MAG TPA: alpha/beta fold hydrolase [Candidatus Binatia bacterium]|nr:alpha/beta fold hydrolase [Candidatus Binatia bacterium]
MREVATTRDVLLHGHRIRYRTAGRGPVVLLIHGIAGTSATWDEIIPALAARYTVIAPDLLGHGDSAKPRGDYSLGAYASGIRDLLAVLGHSHATVIGHSLGGGVAMQFAYQFPQRCDRLVLVSSGGLGEEVHASLRAATLPGSEWVLPLMCAPGVRDAVNSAGSMLARLGLRAGPDLEEGWRGFCSLGDADSRRAFLHTLRTIVDAGGQRVSATDRLYLMDVGLPVMIVWGERDPIIPMQHGLEAHAAVPGSRLELFPGAGHFPHRDDPSRFADVLLDFLDTTEPADITDEKVHELLRRRAS